METNIKIVKQRTAKQEYPTKKFTTRNYTLLQYATKKVSAIKARLNNTSLQSPKLSNPSHTFYASLQKEVTKTTHAMGNWLLINNNISEFNDVPYIANFLSIIDSVEKIPSLEELSKLQPPEKFIDSLKNDLEKLRIDISSNLTQTMKPSNLSNILSTSAFFPLKNEISINSKFSSNPTNNFNVNQNPTVRTTNSNISEKNFYTLNFAEGLKEFLEKHDIEYTEYESEDGSYFTIEKAKLSEEKRGILSSFTPDVPEAKRQKTSEM